jgi:putative phosphoesterase
MRILVLSDTHIPRSAADIPKLIYDEIEKVDMILHAGDFIEKAFLDKLAVLRETKAVCGNMDSPKLKEILKQKEMISVGNLRIGLIHGYGAPSELVATVSSEFSSVDAIVFGHSHSALNLVKDGVLYFNPGSPTDKIFATENTYGILEVNNKKIEGRIVRL